MKRSEKRKSKAVLLRQLQHDVNLQGDSDRLEGKREFQGDHIFQDDREFQGDRKGRPYHITESLQSDSNSFQDDCKGHPYHVTESPRLFLLRRRS